MSDQKDKFTHINAPSSQTLKQTADLRGTRRHWKARAVREFVSARRLNMTKGQYERDSGGAHKG